MTTPHQAFAALEVLPEEAELSAPEAGSPARLTSAQAALKYMLAGKATFTLKGQRSRFTYKLTASKDKRVTFVALMNGPDNQSSYVYMGFIRHTPTGPIYYHGGRKARVGQDAPSAKAFKWTYEQLCKGNFPAGLEIWHEGRCGRCSRPLTVPESIASGFGPECIQHVH